MERSNSVDGKTHNCFACMFVYFGDSVTLYEYDTHSSVSLNKRNRLTSVIIKVTTSSMTTDFYSLTNDNNRRNFQNESFQTIKNG